jgi:FkbM family methyltransferase
MNIYFKETQFGHFCLIEKDLISNCVNDYGYWEQHLYYFYSQFIKPNSIIIDGGANIGFHSIQFANLANQGKVYCFEPQPLIFNVLSTNILINGVTDIIKQYRLGLGDQANIKLRMTPIKEQEFSSTCINYGGRSLTNSDQGEEEVSMITIDDLKLDRLDFIKLDVQGFELATLHGGKNTIQTNHPLMFLENYPNSEEDQQVIKLLKEWDYQVYRLLCTEHQEDCIVFHPQTHIEEIKFIENQTFIKYNKI